MIPYPSWLNAGDNAWQLVAATLVGLMSVPGLALLYGGLVQRKWVVNTMLMAFTGFSLVLVAWVLYEFNMAFGNPLTPHLPGILGSFVGKPWPILSHQAEEGQATIPLLDSALPPWHFPKSSLAYFQFAFAAITPLLFLGSVLGRMSFKAWLLFVPLWSGLVYSVNAFLVWGGGFWAAKGALDYSGGYVIHLAAGVSGFVAAAVIGPRLARDKAKPVPNNLMMVAAGAGILWLGWNGFNGGDMYFAGMNASAAVLNTNLATAVGVISWIIMDMLFSKQRKPTFLGGINGMLCGLVGITPAAGYVDGVGAIAIGFGTAFLVWFAWNYLPRTWPFRKVDDAMGVIYTHGFAGLIGGLLTGLLANPGMAVYLADPNVPNSTGFATTGLLFGNPKQLWLQAGAAGTIILWDGVMTFVILMVIRIFVKLRMPDEALETGDVAIHDEEAYPSEPILAGAGAGAAVSSSTTPAPPVAAERTPEPA
jgi:Amt family ammonium transporter